VKVEDVVAHVVRAIDESALRLEPWRHRVLSAALPSDFYDELLDTPVNWAPAQRAKRTVWLLSGAELDNPWFAANIVLRDRRVLEAFNRATRTAGGHPCPRVNLDSEGYSLGRHTDTRQKVGTLSINLCRKAIPEHGMLLHASSGGGIRQTEFEPNGGYLFQRTMTSVHSVNRVTAMRRSLMVPFFCEARRVGKV
jgi:hypothetical protein